MITTQYPRLLIPEEVEEKDDEDKFHLDTKTPKLEFEETDGKLLWKCSLEEYCAEDECENFRFENYRFPT